MDFEIIGSIINPTMIAKGLGIRDRERLRREYGGKRWRKMKGMANVRRANGAFSYVEIHWYEEGSVGRKEYKIKATIR